MAVSWSTDARRLCLAQSKIHGPAFLHFAVRSYARLVFFTVLHLLPVRATRCHYAEFWFDSLDVLLGLLPS